MAQNAKRRADPVGKRRMLLAGIFAASAAGILWFTGHPLRSYDPVDSQTVPDAGAPQAAVPFYSMNLTAHARENLAKEFLAYNVSYAPQTYYAQLGQILDADGALIYGTETLALSAPRESYEFSQSRLGMYLFGDTESAAETIIGPEALMRTAEVDSEDFITGASLQLSLRSDLERQIHRLFTDNGISGGCIMQDTATGRIEVMTATSISQDNLSGTELDALHLEKSGLTQLEPCIDPSAVLGFGLTDDQCTKYFDYKKLSSERVLQDEFGTDQYIRRYHYMTDFDLLDESADGRISPLHANAVTQAVFSGNTATPTLIAAYVRTAADGTVQTEQLEPKIGAAIPQDICNACMSRFSRTEDTGTCDIQYYYDDAGSFVYVTGRIVTKDGAADKCFTMYARNAAETRNRCIVWLPRCLAYYLTHEEAAQAPAEQPPAGEEPAEGGVYSGEEE